MSVSESEPGPETVSGHKLRPVPGAGPELGPVAKSAPRSELGADFGYESDRDRVRASARFGL